MKLCKNCRYGQLGCAYDCSHKVVEPVSGLEDLMMAGVQRRSADPQHCGPEARFYEPKVEEMKLEWKSRTDGAFITHRECLFKNDECVAVIFIYSDVAIALRRDGSEGGREHFGNCNPNALLNFQLRILTAVRNGTWEKGRK